ncbi:hypothetical protein H5T57_03175 [Candidatus Bipolaricaulota bacterium]|nr:hypothetical protein [Candidatus Bipolaricaulota bacterium]
MAEGSAGIVELRAIRTPTGAVNMRIESVPGGWPRSFWVYQQDEWRDSRSSVASGWGTVEAQYRFTVPPGSAGSTFALRFKAWTAGVIGELELRVILEVVRAVTPTPPPAEAGPSYGPFTGTTDETGRFEVPIPSLPNTSVTGKLTECTVVPLPNREVSITLVPKPGIGTLTRADQIGAVCLSSPGYPEVTITQIGLASSMDMFGRTYTTVDVGTVCLQPAAPPTPPPVAPTGPITGKTDNEGKFTVTLAPGATVTGRLSECTVKPLPNQEFTLSLVPKGETVVLEDLAGFTFAVPGYTETTVTKFSKLSLFGLTSYSVGDVHLTPKCAACRYPIELRDPGPRDVWYTPIRFVQDFDMTCCCECEAVIKGPDLIQLRHGASAEFTVNADLQCTEHSPGGWVSWYSAGDIRWRVSEPASVEGTGRQATVLVPPPTKANQYVQVILTAEWDQIAICVVQRATGVLVYNACLTRCSASKVILLTSECVDLKREIDRIRGEMAAQEGQEKALREKLADLEERLRLKASDLEQEIRRLEQKVQDLIRQEAKAKAEWEAAQREYEAAKAAYDRCEAELRVLEGALHAAWERYRGLPLAARCLAYGRLADALKWPLSRKVQFIRDVLEENVGEEDPQLDLWLAIAVDKCKKAVLPRLSEALVDLGGLVSLIGSNPIDAAASQALSEFVSRYIQEKAEGKDPRQLTVREKLSILRGLIDELEARLRQAQAQREAAYRQLRQAHGQLQRAREAWQTWQQKLQEAERQLEAARRGKEAWEAALHDQITALSEQIDAAASALEKLRRLADELAAEYQRACR